MTTRITGGTHRGRVLRTPTAPGLRPTSERVRSALFSIIGPARVEGGRVADLYAGTGALGLDALSRGAAWVDFVERNGALCAAIRRRLREWKLEKRSKVHRGRVFPVLNTFEKGYDLVLADPPYDSDELVQVVEQLDDRGLINAGGLVVLEHRSDCVQQFATGRLKLEAKRTYGDTAITILSAGA